MALVPTYIYLIFKAEISQLINVTTLPCTHHQKLEDLDIQSPATIPLCSWPSTINRCSIIDP